MKHITPEITVKKFIIAQKDENAELLAEAVEDIKSFPDDVIGEIFLKLLSEGFAAAENGTVEEVIERYRKEIEAHSDGMARP